VGEPGDSARIHRQSLQLRTSRPRLELVTVERLTTGVSFLQLRQSTPDTVEKNYVMTLRGRPFSLQVNGLQLLRKYEEPDRVLLVRSNHLLLPTEGLHFRNNCWTSVTPAASNPHGASIVRTCVQLYADCKDGLAISPRDLEGVKDLALDSLSGMYRKHAQMMQNALIEERGGIATAV